MNCRGDNRYQVSEEFKQSCKENMGLNRYGRIHVVEDNIDIIGEDYGGQLVDFTIEDNCYVKDTFVGTTVAKKITVNILNPDNSINLENKTIEAFVGIKINGKLEEIPYGSYIIEKPDNEEVIQKTSFTGYDYMIKFNVPYKDASTYPIKLSELFKNVCSQVGLEAGNTDFTDADYMVIGNPFTNGENCRTVLSNIAQLAGTFVKIGRDNKVYIPTLKNTKNLLTVKYVNAMTIKELNLTQIKVLSGEADNADEKLDGMNYYEDFSKNNQWGGLNSLVLAISDIEGENTALDDKADIEENGLTEITIQDNYFLIDQAEREKVIVPLWNMLKGLKYLPFKTEYYGYPYLDSGDMIYIYDTEDNGYISYVFNHTFTFNGAFKGNLETTAMTKTQTAYKNTFDVKSKFRRVERLVDKVNGRIEDIIEEQTETSEKLSKHEQDINGIKDTVSSVTEELKEEIKQTGDDINQNLTENYWTKTETESQIEQRADEVKSSVSKTVEERVGTFETELDETNAKIDGLQVGSRNLALNTKKFFEGNFSGGTGGSSWTDGSKTIEEDNSTPSGFALKITYYAEGKTVKEVNTTSIKDLSILQIKKLARDYNNVAGGYMSASNLVGGLDKLIEGETYTASFWIKADKEAQLVMDNVIEGQTIIEKNSDGIISTQWKKIVVTFKWTNTSNFKSCFYIKSPANITIWLSSYMLEKGTIPTDWTPAPEDIENTLTTDYYTKTETNSQIIQKADEIIHSVNTTIEETKQEAIDSANASTDEKLKEYSTTTQMNSTITQKADEITNEVNKKLESYDTSEEVNSKIEQKAANITSTVNETIEKATQQAIDSANSSTDEKLKEYTKTTQMNSIIDQKANSVRTEVSATISDSIEASEKNIKALLELKLNIEDLISEINASADIIRLTAGRLIITSGNFKLDASGNITATGGTIGGFTLGQTEFIGNLSGTYAYNIYDLRAAMAMVMEWLEKPSLFDIYDVDGNGKIDSMDFSRIIRIMNGTETNTKNITGTFKINSKDPKNCITVSRNGELAVSIGVGGINTNNVTCEDIICGYMAGNSSEDCYRSINKRKNPKNYFSASRKKWNGNY